jgi:hypothetical protein
VPIFVQITQAEPAFFQGNSSGPSLHIVLLSAQANAGLARFATVDIIGSFIFGSPQMILWDPAFVPELARLQWDEWIPGCPLYFMLVLGTINIWRGQHPHTRDLNEWIQLEHNVQTWQPQQTHCLKSANSWRTLGRLAVQEAFRHMTLIYLYVVCFRLASRWLVLSYQLSTYRVWALLGVSILAYKHPVTKYRDYVTWSRQILTYPCICSFPQ